MTIIVCIWSIRIGGAETFAIDLCKYLGQRGYNVFLFPVLSPWDDEYYKFIKSSGVRVLSIYENKFVDWASWKINAVASALGFKGFRTFLAGLFFKKAIKRYNIRFAISNSVIADNFVYSNKDSALHHIVVEHGEYSYAAFDGTAINSTGLLNANSRVCVSQWCQKILAEHFKLSATIIYNGHARRGISDQETSVYRKGFTFCMLGRGITQKGWDEAVEAFLQVKNEYPNTTLILIGGGEVIDQLKAKYEGSEEIVFAGRVINPASIISRADVGLVPSRKYEAFGITILDFFAHGKPVLASDVGAIPEIVRYGGMEGGAVVPVDESGRIKTSVLATQMLSMMQDHERLSKTSEDAQEIYKSFAFEETGRKYEELMTKIVSTNG